MTNESAPLFSEEQRFTTPWLWALLTVVTVTAWLGVAAVLLADDGGDGGDRWVVMLVGLLVGIGVPVLFAVARLTVEVHADRVDIRYRPFTRRAIRLDDVLAADAVTYDALREYGGWGIKGWSRRKIAYNVRGDRGVLLTLTDGRTVLLGSQQSDDLATAIRRGLPDRT